MGVVMWQLIPAAICWSLWEQRNRRTFEGSSGPYRKIVDAILSRIMIGCLSLLDLTSLRIDLGFFIGKLIFLGTKGVYIIFSLSLVVCLFRKHPSCRCVVFLNFFLIKLLYLFQKNNQWFASRFKQRNTPNLQLSHRHIPTGYMNMGFEFSLIRTSKEHEIG